MRNVSILHWGSCLLLLWLSNWLHYSSRAEEVTTVDVHKAKSLVESGHVYVDVRTAEEFRAAHPDADKIWKLRGQADESDEVDPNFVAAAEDDDMISTKKIYNIPYMLHASQGRVRNPDFMEKVKKMFNQDDHLVVGCQSGVRSLSATADLLSAGFKHSCNMGGGYLAWDKNGFPVKKQEEL